MKQRILIASLFCLFASFLFGEEAQQKEIKTLQVGTSGGYAPYVSLDEQGNYVGFDVDVAELLAKKLNRKLVLKDYGSMPSLFLALKQKKVDSLMWAVSITEERMKNMNMVYYHGEMENEIPILFWKEVPKGVQKLEDLGKDPNKTICVEAGSSEEDILKKYLQPNLKYVDKITDAIMEIKYGKSLATSADPALIPVFQAQYPELRVQRFLLPPSDRAMGYGICVNKDNPKLTQEVQQAVKELIAEGKIAALEKKWNLAK